MSLTSHGGSPLTCVMPPSLADLRTSPYKRGMFHLRRHVTGLPLNRDTEQRMFALFRQNFCGLADDPGVSMENDQAYQLMRESLIRNSTIILLDKLTRFGRNPEVVDIVLHSDSSGQMVSRLHAEITADMDPNDPLRVLRYSICDRSLNGTYVNDRRAPTETGKMFLNRGDIIKFGHTNGASFKPGEFAVANESEFVFTFEPCYDTFEYLGHTWDGNRIERRGPLAYIHIGATSLLVHEFDMFSLVPKREGELSIVPMGCKLNTEAKRMEYVQMHAMLTRDLVNLPDAHLEDRLAAGSTNLFKQSLIVPSMTNSKINDETVLLLQELANARGTSYDDSIAFVIQQLQQQLTKAPTPSTYSWHPQLNHLLKNPLFGNSFANFANPAPQEPVVNALKTIFNPVINSQTNLYGANQVNAAMSALLGFDIASVFPNLDVSVSSAAPSVPPLPSSAPGPSTSTSGESRDGRQRRFESPDGNISASSTTSEETARQYSDTVSLPSSSTHSELGEGLLRTLEATRLRKAEEERLAALRTASTAGGGKVQLNEQMLAAIARAAAAASTTLYKPVAVPGTSSDARSDEQVRRLAEESKEQNIQSAAVLANAERILSSRSAMVKPKVEKVDKVEPVSQETKMDHIMETIDFVTKQVMGDLSLSGKSTEQLSPVSVDEKTTKKRRKKRSIDQAEENGKSKENVLKLLDVAAAEIKETATVVVKKEEPESLPSVSTATAVLTTTVAPMTSISVPATTSVSASVSVTAVVEPELPTTAGPSTPAPKEVNEGTERERSSSTVSLIVCEVQPDDPGLLSGSNDDLLTEKKPETLPPELQRKRLSGSSHRKKKHESEKKDRHKERKKEKQETAIVIQPTPSTSDAPTDAVESKPAPPKASSPLPEKALTPTPTPTLDPVTTPVPPYTPSPASSKSSKKQARVGAHKSNEVARLLFDLDGSYFQTAHKKAKMEAKQKALKAALAELQLRCAATEGTSEGPTPEEQARMLAQLTAQKMAEMEPQFELDDSDIEEIMSMRPLSAKTPVKRKSAEPRDSVSPAKKIMRSREPSPEAVVRVRTDRSQAERASATRRSPSSKPNGLDRKSKSGKDKDRHHRDRDKDKEKDKEREKEKKKDEEKDREREKYRERERDRHHHRHHRHDKDSLKHRGRKSKKSAPLDDDSQDSSDSNDSEDERTVSRNKKNNSSSRNSKKEGSKRHDDKSRRRPGRQPSKSPKKKRGRRAKENKDDFEITEILTNEWESCGYRHCYQPEKGDDGVVNWVQCDDCDVWYHVYCAFGHNDRTVIGDSFHCGCCGVKASAGVVFVA